MRRSILLLLAGTLGCGAGETPDRAVIPDFLDRSTAVRCTRVHLAGEPAITELRATTDSTFAVLDEPAHAVLEYDDEYRLLFRLDYPATGPGSAGAAVSAALLGDTAVAVAGRAGLRLVVLRRDGELLRSDPLDFIPHSLEALPGGGLLITSMPLGDRPPTLLLRHDGAELTPLPVRPRPYDDMMIRGLGNAALVESLPSGDALVVHQFLAPRAFRVSADGGVTALAVPVPDATVRLAEFVPTAPVTEDQMPRMLIPAMALSIDPLRSEVYLLTRSGGQVGGRPQRALLRLDERLGYLESFTLDVLAGAMAFLPRRRTALVVDEEDRVHACKLPEPGSAADHAD